MIMAEDKCLYKKELKTQLRSQKTKSSPRKNQHLSWDAEQRSEGRREVANWERALADCGKSIPGRTISSPTVLQQGAQCVQENWRQGDEPWGGRKRKETGFPVLIWLTEPVLQIPCYFPRSLSFLADNTEARHCFKHFTHINSSLTQQ